MSRHSVVVVKIPEFTDVFSTSSLDLQVGHPNKSQIPCLLDLKCLSDIHMGMVLSTCQISGHFDVRIVFGDLKPRCHGAFYGA